MCYKKYIKINNYLKPPILNNIKDWLNVYGYLLSCINKFSIKFLYLSCNDLFVGI